MGYLNCNYLFTCESVTDHEDGKMTYHKVFEVMDIELPTKIEFFLVAGIEYDLEETEERAFFVNVMSPDELIMNREEIKHTVDPSEGELSFVVGKFRMKNFPIQKKGFYTFNVEYNKKIVASHNVFVTNKRGDN